MYDTPLERWERVGSHWRGNCRLGVLCSPASCLLLVQLRSLKRGRCGGYALGHEGIVLQRQIWQRQKVALANLGA